MAGDLLNQVLTLLQTPEPPSLGPGPRAHVKSAQTITGLVRDWAREGGASEHQEALVRALILLWHDQLDAAHRIVQEIDDADGSLLHAIMHRREPDYQNSKYWWRRTGRHAVFPLLATALRETFPEGLAMPQGVLSGSGDWDPDGFVDVCQRLAEAPGDDPEHQAALAVQRTEFETILKYLCEPTGPVIGPR